MNIILASIFRNAADYIDRYFEQAEHLRDTLEFDGHTMRLVIAEGDSTDDSYAMLDERLCEGDVLLKVDHGGREFGSVDVEERWRQISEVCNAIMDYVTDEIEDADALIYVESDLIWTTETMLNLLGHITPQWGALAASPDGSLYVGGDFTSISGGDGLATWNGGAWQEVKRVDAVAPMCHKRSIFYDTWGHRSGGVRFTNHAPYHPMLEEGRALYPMDSAGSCVVMRGDVARAARFGETDGIVGLGRSIRDNGYRLWLDATERIEHP